MRDLGDCDWAKGRLVHEGKCA